MRALGARVEYRQTDVADRDAVAELIRDMMDRFGRIDGLLHCAGVTRDGFMHAKSAADFALTLAPKVTGTISLDEATRDLDLDFFLLCSSNAANLGNPGQADYAAANGFEEAFAEYRFGLVRQGGAKGARWPCPGPCGRMAASV